jgi:hypothetical protein
MQNALAAALLWSVIAAFPATATAQVEVEVDPIAYALHGYSLHVAKVLGRTRLDVGAFGVEVPSRVHGNEGWTATMRGVGLKWDYVGSSSYGAFVGVDPGYVQARYTVDATGQSETRGIIGIGIRGGYRLPLGPRGLYVTPWASVSYNLGGDEVRIGNARFARKSVEIFPTIHIGWRF